MMNKYLGKLKNEIKIIRALLRSRSASNGMTYVELIVVLSIFSVMTSVILFNYNKFEENVDIKVLANDIALKIVEAQKSSLSGKWNSNATNDWKPSYGINFDVSSISEKSKFKYFANFNDDFYNSSDFIIEESNITRGVFVSKLQVVGCTPSEVNNLSVIFRRPNSIALFASGSVPLSCATYAQITVSSPSDTKACIQVYSSGRSQIGQCK